jgi:hypothetical protein
MMKKMTAMLTVVSGLTPTIPLRLVYPANPGTRATEVLKSLVVLVPGVRVEHTLKVVHEVVMENTKP